MILFPSLLLKVLFWFLHREIPIDTVFREKKKNAWHKIQNRFPGSSGNVEGWGKKTALPIPGSLTTWLKLQMGFLILQANLHYLPWIICPPLIGDEKKKKAKFIQVLGTSHLENQLLLCPGLSSAPSPTTRVVQNRPASWWTLELKRGACDFSLRREELILSLTEKLKRPKGWNSSSSTCSCQQSPYLQRAEALQTATCTPCRASGEPGNSQHYSFKPFKPPAKATLIIF